MSRLATRGEKAPPPAPANSRQRTVLIAVLVLIVLVSAGASYAWSRTISSAAGPTTGPNSHVHTLIVQRNGTLLLGDQQGLWRSRTGKTWRGYGPPLSHLMPLCVVRLGRTILSCSTGLVTGHAFAGTPRALAERQCRPHLATHVASRPGRHCPRFQSGPGKDGRCLRSTGQPDGNRPRRRVGVYQGRAHLAANQPTPRTAGSQWSGAPAWQAIHGPVCERHHTEHLEIRGRWSALGQCSVGCLPAALTGHQSDR